MIKITEIATIIRDIDVCCTPMWHAVLLGAVKIGRGCAFITGDEGGCLSLEVCPFCEEKIAVEVNRKETITSISEKYVHVSEKNKED